jgi:hypothetical protein
MIGKSPCDGGAPCWRQAGLSKTEYGCLAGWLEGW